MPFNEDHVLLVRLDEKQKALQNALDDMKETQRITAAEIRVDIAALKKAMDEIHDIFTKYKFAAVVVVVIGSIVGGTLAAITQIAGFFGWKH